jgi:hypothetical protein
MLALAAYRDTRCDRCGGGLDEGTDPKNEDSYYHLEPLQCFRCLEFARAEKQYEDQPFPHTLMHRVELRR